MTLRANYFELAPEAIQLLMQQENYLRTQFQLSDTISLATWELVKLRISQLNECAFCIDMHSKEMLNQNETIERIVGLNAWQSMPMYSRIERAALCFAECLTVGKNITDETYQKIVNIVGDQAIVNLTIAINAINSWNRLAKTFKLEVGSYKPS